MAEVLERIAARTPAPAGGSAAAIAGAVAAALVEMVGGLMRERRDADPATAHGRSPASAGRARAAQLSEDAGELRARLLALATEGIASYEPVLGALALEVSDPRRATAVAEALSNASSVPRQIAEAAAEVGELAAELEEGEAGEHLRGDLRVAIQLARAAV